MTGLRAHVRDARLPELSGEADLCPPPEARLLDLVAEHLSANGTPRAETATLAYTRWKPGVSTTASYELAFSDGETRTVTWKRYRGEKAAHLALDLHDQASGGDAEERLRPVAVVAAERTCLSTFPFDRELPGAARALDLSRVAHRVDRLAVFVPWVVRRRPSRATLLRYKPERRAVVRLDLALRGGTDGGERAERRLVARVLPLREAARVCDARRRALGGDGAALGPELVGYEEHTGTLLEEFVEGEVPAPDAFDHAALVGAALARLHTLPAPLACARSSPDLGELAPLFAVDDGLRRRFASLALGSDEGALRWIHGDLHPDQVALEPDGGARLLDLDRLRLGAPVEDVASWAADALAEHPGSTLEAACEPLLAGYLAGGGPRPAAASLSRAVALELVRRAAAAIRRLERGAVQKADALLARAAELGAQGRRP